MKAYQTYVLTSKGYVIAYLATLAILGNETFAWVFYEGGGQREY